MAKRPTPGELLRTAVKIGAIPDGASIDRKGRATWQSDEFALAAMIYPGRDGRLAWRAFVGDAKLGPAMADYGSLMVGIEAANDDSLAWPTEALHDFLHQGIGAAKTFVTDRADLAALLASEFNVQRGHLTTWLPHPSYPARLVQALVLARDLGDEALVETVRARLRSGVQTLADGREVDIFATAGRWAKDYAKVLGFAIPL